MTPAPPWRPSVVRLRDWWHVGLLVWLGAMAAYLATLPHRALLEDAGVFLMACQFCGVAHPPGYPLYTLLCKLFTLLPIGSVVFRGALLSAVFGAATGVAVAFVTQALLASRVAAAIAGLAYSVSRVFWSQAIMPEVYTLNTFLFFTLLALAIQFVATGRRSLMPWIGFLLGLSLSNHWPLIVISSPALALMLWPRRGDVVRTLPATVAAMLLGLTPYVYLFVRANMDPAVSFYGPFRSLDDYLFFVSRRGYRAAEFVESADWFDHLGFLAFFGQQTLGQFTYAGVVLAGAGGVSHLRRWPTYVWAALAAAFVGSGPLLAFALNFNYEFLQLAIFRVYPLIPYGVVAILIGAGVAAVRALVASWSPPSVATGAAAAVGVGLVVTLVTTAFSENDRRTYTYADEYGRAVLEALEPSAVLLTHGDVDTGVLGYLRLVEGVRPDVDIYNDQGLVFGNRLFHPVDESQRRLTAVAEFIKQTGRPIYLIASDIPQSLATEDFGLFKKVRKDQPAGSRAFSLPPRVLDFFERLVARDPGSDAWTIDHRNTLLAGAGRALSGQAFGPQPPGRRVQLLYERVMQTFPGRLARLEFVIEIRPPGVTTERGVELAAEAETLLNDMASKEARSRLYYLKGHALARANRPAEAVEQFRQSVAVNPRSNNRSILNLLEFYASKGDRAGYLELRARFPEAAREFSEIAVLDRKIR